MRSALERRLADRHHALLRALARAPAARPPRCPRPSARARSPRRRAGRRRTSARAARGRAGPPARCRCGWASSFSTSPRVSTCGSLRAAPRRAQRGGGIGVEQPVAAQVAVERAQAGALAVDRGRRGGRAVRRRPCASRSRKSATSPGVASSADSLALLQEAAVLQQVGAVRLERVAGEPALELEIGEEVEHQVLEPRSRPPAFRSWPPLRVSPRGAAQPFALQVSGSGTPAARAGRRASSRRGCRGSRRPARRAATPRSRCARSRRSRRVSS